MSAAPRPLGVLMAGGRSRRYGETKAFAQVDGRSLAERALAALRTAADRVVVVANEPEAYASLGLEVRPDVVPELGPVGGIRTAVVWAAELGLPGALVVACDMPFVSGGLLRLLARPPGDADVMVPESTGRRGVEPLCAWYGPRCGPAIEAAVARGDRSVIGFWDALVVERVPLARVRELGDPERLFMNVNTPEERERAERMAQEGP